MNKEVYKFEEVRGKILSAIDRFSNPIINTMTPKGKNVLYQDNLGNINSSNDGYNIAKNISFEDEVENSIIDIIKHSAIKTNLIAGDGTTTATLLASTLIKEGFKLIDGGWNQMELKRELDKVSDLLSESIDKQKKVIKDDKDLNYIANVSSNNDKEIADNVTKVVNSVGLDGMVFIEANKNNDVEIVEEKGFTMEQGMESPYLSNVNGRQVANYSDVPVLITDKSLYYEDECFKILETVSKMGHNSVVIVAKKFLGKSSEILISNHISDKSNINILLVSDKTEGTEVLDDLATYLGGQIFSDKRGSMVKELSTDDFMMAKKVYSDRGKTIIKSSKDKNPALEVLVENLRDEKKKAKNEIEEEKIGKRIASMTSGLITIKVGAKTVPEMNEKIHRYEDSINATRNAIKDGYVVGGGLALKKMYDDISSNDLFKELPSDLNKMIKTFCEAPLVQIAKNCNLHLPTLMEKVAKGNNIGYNANSDKYEDLLKAGIIEPVTVLKNVVENSMSVARTILSSDYIIVNKKEKENEN